jgi:acetylornithine deacetylase
MLARHRAADPTFDASARVMLSRPAFEARPDSPLVATVVRQLESETESSAQLIGETPWMDSALLGAAGVDTVVIGPHGEGAHAAVEWVELQSVERLARVLAGTVMEYCR